MKKNLKPVPADKKKSLGKLPKKVRNKMGFMSQGGLMKKKGTKRSEPKEKKPLSVDPLNLANPKKMKMGGQVSPGTAKVRGMGAATKGGKFSGVF